MESPQDQLQGELDYESVHPSYLKDRESILLGISTGKTLDTIAKEIGRYKEYSQP